MDVVIDEVASRVNVADGEALLTPALLRKIVESVMAQVKREDRQRHGGHGADRQVLSADQDRAGHSRPAGGLLLLGRQRLSGPAQL